ncbi:MAG: glycosyltransferase [Bifidobacteriaceae bacterium]|jgi:glycosyltransferase involved in cell wall biosynthesis|nr:glycosyltransferase [Bifidobacteriaceae bacterium]
MKIVFVGPNFYGVGGVEEATVALASALAKQGHNITLLSLQKWGNRPIDKNINWEIFLDHDDFSLKSKIKRKLPQNSKLYDFLSMDNYVADNLNPYVINRLVRHLKNLEADIVISVRESFHYILNCAQNKKIMQKGYFFHARPDAYTSLKPIINNILKKMELGKVLFVTENLSLALKKEYNYSNYLDSKVLGNTVLQSAILDKQMIKQPVKKDNYKGVILTRFSPGKEQDLKNILQAGQSIKNYITSQQKTKKTISIDLYGGGKYKETFAEQIKQAGLENILHMKGVATHSGQSNISIIRQADFLADFSSEQSFGMVYLEAILNGKPVIASLNSGSKEILQGMNNYIFTDSKQIPSKILDFEKLTKLQLQKYYDQIYAKFAPEIVSRRFIDFFSDKL